MSQSNICPICGEGQLSQETEWVTVEHRGVSGQIQSLYSVCDHCGSEQAGAAELRANKRAMIAFKKRVDGLLTGEEVRALRERLGLSQTQAAKVFGGGPVAFSKYESDDVAQSEAMDKLLRLTDAMPEVFARLASGAGIVPTLKSSGPVWRTANKPPANKADALENLKRPNLRAVHTARPDKEKKYA